MVYFKQTLDPSKLDLWYPIEVWELNRWSSPGYLDEIGHRRRAFSCMGLMAGDFTHRYGLGELLDVLLPLFESLVRLNLTNWTTYFLDFLLFGLRKTKHPEDRFNLQFLIFLTKIIKEDDADKLQSAYSELLKNDNVVFGKYNTWDSPYVCG